MILSAAVDNGQPGYPWLVFLHGFSGDRNEWRKVGDAFPAWPRLYLDLPGHGGSADIAVQDFAGVNTLLQSMLNSYNIHKYWLIGYSLGGRVAMNFASQPRAGMRGLIVEGGHPGLQDVGRGRRGAAMTAPGRNVFAASRLSRSLPTGISSRSSLR